MKVLFLDFDGVLNSEKYVRSCGHYGVIIDPSQMILLKQIINATGTDINRIFSEYQLVIFDKTPKLNTEREKEIKAWLDENTQVEAFAVLDDAFLSAKFLNDHFVKTSNLRNGLDEDDVKNVINILTEVHYEP